MSRIIIMVGPSNSGKSTWANQFVKEHENFYIVNRDCIRQMLKGKNWLNDHDELLISRMIHLLIIECLESGRDIIVDSTNTNAQTINRIIERYTSLADIEFKVMEDVSLKDLFIRNKRRAVKENILPIPKYVIRSMFEGFNKLKEEFDFTEIKQKE